MTITELYPSSSKINDDPDPLSRYPYIEQPQEIVYPGISQEFGTHQDAIHRSGAVAVLSAVTGWERFVLAGSYEVQRTMAVGATKEERLLRQYMTLYCTGVEASRLRDRIYIIDGDHNMGLNEEQLAALGLAASERRRKEGYHNGCFNAEIPYHALRALKHHAYELTPEVEKLTSNQVA